MIKEIYPFFVEVFSKLGVEEDDWGNLLASATKEGHADVALPCHSLSKILKKSPLEISSDVINLLSNDLSQIAKISCMNGFINVRATNDWMGSKLQEISSDSRLGIPEEDNRKIVVDYSAPNVAKEMHVGHLRSTVIGDSIVRILLFKGHTVIRENHIGDWGTPFGMLI
ncbi:MAG: arginyl-tRNA synthetase [Candidatus Thalassarchaeaceae archaeon]